MTQKCHSTGIFPEQCSKICNLEFFFQISRSAFSIQHPIDCFRTTIKKREGPNSTYLLIFMAMTALTITPAIGEGAVAYYYVRTRYSWDVEEYSAYNSIMSTCSIVGMLIGHAQEKIIIMKFSHSTPKRCPRKQPLKDTQPTPLGAF